MKGFTAVAQTIGFTAILPSNCVESLGTPTNIVNAIITNTEYIAILKGEK